MTDTQPTAMGDVDALLRGAFTRIAAPGDSAGVADAIRTRMDAGDIGTPAASSGFGSGPGWVLPWLVGGLLLATAGFGIGLSGLLGAPFAPAETPAVSLQHRASALDCPGGAPIVDLGAGSRVLAVARSEDGSYLGVRNPFDTGRTVWLPISTVTPDDDGAVGSLPIEDCPTVVSTIVAPTAEPAPDDQPSDPQQPAPAPGPKPVADSSAPTLGQAFAAPTVIYNGEATVVHLSATDNVGVTGVSVQLSGAYSGTRSMTKVGSEWQLTFSIPENNYYGMITFTLRAMDAAGNQSAPLSLTVDHQYFG